MNINPKATTILCFGDSNTWGQKPDKSSRYPANIRWTGELQRLLGKDYYIIEEGLGSRTTDIEYTKKPGRNGSQYLQPCLESHNPLDFVVIMLGTNDLKTVFNRSPEKIAESINHLVKIVHDYGTNKAGKTPAIILISPILINSNAPNFTKMYAGIYNSQSALKSAKLSKFIKTVAEKSNAIFIDASKFADSGDDGLHLSEESHTRLAEVVAREIELN